MTKSTLVDALPELPDEFSIDELIERLLLIETIENGRRQYQEGKIPSSEDVKKQMAEWIC